MLQSQLSNGAIRDTVTAVFRNSAYTEQIQDTLGRRILQWIQMMIDRLSQAAREHPAIVQIVRAFIILIAIAVIVRAIYLAVERARLKAEALRNAAAGIGNPELQDAWYLAEKYAKEGNYTEAAHAIYRHLLESLRQSENIKLHPSKTVGDYARDLRSRSSVFFSRYRDFARSYEVVIYGHGIVDRDRYHQLLALAQAITRKNG